MLAPPRNTRNNVRLSMWAPCGPVTLTHKTTHHTRLELVTDPPPLLMGCLASLASPRAQP